jgi:DNA modification methylase
MPYSGNKLHPTQKPVAALVPLIRSFSLPGEVVFDPFAGSGSSCAAALLTGRKYIGIELNAEYFSEASRRMDRVKARISTRRSSAFQPEVIVSARPPRLKASMPLPELLSWQP